MSIPKLAELLATPERWTQKLVARAGTGKQSVESCDRRATSWCLFGAAIKISGGTGHLFECINDSLSDACHELHDTFDFIGWQDCRGRTHAEVLAVAKRADELIAQRIQDAAESAEPK